jgi:hypothetical protein
VAELRLSVLETDLHVVGVAWFKCVSQSGVEWDHVVLAVKCDLVAVQVLGKQCDSRDDPVTVLSCTVMFPLLYPNQNTLLTVLTICQAASHDSRRSPPRPPSAPSVNSSLLHSVNYKKANLTGNTHVHEPVCSHYCMLCILISLRLLGLFSDCFPRSFNTKILCAFDFPLSQLFWIMIMCKLYKSHHPPLPIYFIPGGPRVLSKVLGLHSSDKINLITVDDIFSTKQYQNFLLTVQCTFTFWP